MASNVTIYGKDTCPYTTAARDDYASRGVAVEYLNVKKDAAAMRRFLELSGGDRRVPLIIENGRVSIGFGGT
jgi:glutaredoxin 3